MNANDILQGYNKAKGITTSTNPSSGSAASFIQAYDTAKAKPSVTVTKKVSAPAPTQRSTVSTPLEGARKALESLVSNTKKAQSTQKTIGGLKLNLSPASQKNQDAQVMTALSKPLSLQPNQKKLTSTQLQQVSGTSPSRTVLETPVSQVVNYFKNFGKATKEEGVKNITSGLKRVPPTASTGTGALLKTAQSSLRDMTPSEASNPLTGPFQYLVRKLIEHATRKHSVTTVGDMLPKENDLTLNIGQKLIESGRKGMQAETQAYSKLGLPEIDESAPIQQKVKDPRWLVRSLSLNVPSFLTSMGLALGAGAVSKNPAVTFAVAFSSSAAQNAGDAYEEAKNNGASDNTAEFAASLVGVINGTLDAIGIGEIIDQATKPIRGQIVKEIIKNIAISSATEGSTESLQQIVQNVVAKRLYDSGRDLLANVAESGLLGTIMGGAAGGGISSAQLTLSDGKTLDVEAGEKTPQEVAGLVVANGLEGTTEGKELMKIVVEAQKTGQNIVIEAPIEQKPVEKVVTPVINENTIKTTDIQGKPVEQEFVRLATKVEQKSPTAKSRGYNTFPDKEGYVKIFKPYGEKGAGYYYERKVTEAPKAEVSKPKTSDIPPELQPLAEEAKKYKSAEEFVNAQEYKTADEITNLGNDIPKKYNDSLFVREKVNLNDLAQTDHFDVGEYKQPYFKSMFSEAKKGKELPPIIADKDGNIIDGNHRLEAYVKANREYQFIYKEVPKTKSQLTDLYNQATKPVEKPVDMASLQKKMTEEAAQRKPVPETKVVEKPAETPKPTVEVAKAEVKPKDNEFVSRVYKRAMAENPELLEEGGLVSKVNLKEESEKAVKLIEEDKQKAFRVAMNVDDSPGVLNNVVNIALREKALKEGNTTLYQTLLKKGSFAQTRRGQEIVSEKAAINDNGTSRYVKELLNARLELLGDKFTTDIKTKLSGSRSKRGLDAIDKEVQRQKKTFVDRKMDIEKAQAFINSLICK